jgi:CheY-like chemotaxis protein
VVLCESEVIRGMTRMLDRLIGANTTLVSELAAERNVRADPSQIEQMVMNLVLNAADAMPAGGVIRLETRDVSFERDAVDRPADLPPGDYVVLSVSDRGVGMDEATRTRIFEPFFTTKGLGKGTGLGLSTVYGIVKQSLGHITVDSALGRGTTLRIYLPAVDEPRTPAAKPKLVSVGPGRGETLLLVEDNKTVRTLIAEATSAQGYALVAVDGVRAALRALEQEPSVALVICDVALGDGTGPELVERVRASHPALPVLFISGHAQDAISPAVLADPHVAFLPKPFSLAVLEAKVRETLDAAAAAQATRTRMRA